MTARVAHLFPDSPFLSFTVDMFEAAAPGANTFLVHGATRGLARHHLPAEVPVETVAAGTPEGLEHVNAVVRDSDVAVFHSVGGFAAAALAAAPPHVLTVWSGWGGDYYGSDWSPASGLLDPLSARYQRSRMIEPGTVLRAYRTRRAARVLHRAAEAADVFSAPIPEDLSVFRHRFPEFHGRYEQLNYASVEDTYSLNAEAGSGDDILLGNSASVPNNHLDVLELLAGVGIDGRRIIAPLSYGDGRYADAVTRRGRELFGDAFVPLRDFMPLAEYQAVIAGCGTVVMGHRRQQAIGNVATALWAGARVILHDRSPLFAFFRDRGAHVMALSSVAECGVPHERASEQELAANRRVLGDFWERERVVANVRQLVSSRAI